MDINFRWAVTWCSGGDFNVIRYPHEKKGGRRITPSMEKFSDFINGNELIDLPLVGRKYRWSNNTERAAMSRLDRFLVSREWDEFYAGAIQVGLPRRVSDHCPHQHCPLRRLTGGLDLFSLRIVGSYTKISQLRSENGGLS